MLLTSSTKSYWIWAQVVDFSLLIFVPPGRFLNVKTQLVSVKITIEQVGSYREAVIAIGGNHPPALPSPL